MSPVLPDEIFQLGSLVLYLADLTNELVRKHIYEVVQLVTNTQKHISNVVLPVSNRVFHVLVLSESFLSLLLDLYEVLHATLVAFVNKVNFSFVNQALNAGICLFFVLPEVEWKSMVWTLGSLLLLPAIFALLLRKVHVLSRDRLH